MADADPRDLSRDMHDLQVVAPGAAPHPNAAKGLEYAANRIRHRHCGSGVRAACVRECRKCDIPQGRRRRHPTEGSSQAEDSQDRQSRVQATPPTEVTSGRGRRSATSPGRATPINAPESPADTPGFPHVRRAAARLERPAQRLARTRPAPFRSRRRDRRPSRGHGGRADQRRECRSPGRFAGHPRQPGCRPAERPSRARTIR